MIKKVSFCWFFRPSISCFFLCANIPLSISLGIQIPPLTDGRLEDLASNSGKYTRSSFRPCDRNYNVLHLASCPGELGVAWLSFAEGTTEDGDLVARLLVPGLPGVRFRYSLCIRLIC